MPTAIIMPKFEMAQETGKVAAWLKAEGDVIKKGDAILEVETDKLNQEVEAEADGILAGLTARAGDVVPIGKTIGYILKPGEALPGAAPATPAAPETQPAAGRAAAGASPLALRLAESLGVDPGAVTGTGPRGQVTREDVETYAAAQQTAAAAGAGKVRAVPAARRLARELGVDLQRVTGTGPEGRIQPEDVRALAEGASPSVASFDGSTELAEASGLRPSAEDAPSAISHPPSAISPTPAIRRLVPLTNIRRTIAERMTASVREAPQFNISVETDMTRALAIVEDLRGADSAGHGQPRITLTALLVKACAWTLSQHPGVNAAYQDDQIAEWAEVNIGVATAIDAGLIVPVIRQADALGMAAIAARLADLTVRARENRLKLEDLQSGTFTVSNLGMFGIDQFTAILNPPQAAILAVGRVAKRTVVTTDDRIEVRPMTTLTLTADHRVLDGATAARFLAALQRVLEHPGLLLA